MPAPRSRRRLIVTLPGNRRFEANIGDGHEDDERAWAVVARLAPWVIDAEWRVDVS